MCGGTLKTKRERLLKLNRCLFGMEIENAISVELILGRKKKGKFNWKTCRKHALRSYLYLYLGKR